MDHSQFRWICYVFIVDRRCPFCKPAAHPWAIFAQRKPNADWKALHRQSAAQKEHLADQALTQESNIPDAVWLSALAPAPMAALVAGLPGLAGAAECGEAGDGGDGGE